MLRKVQNIVAMVALMSLMVACQSLTGQTTGSYIDDTTVTTSVKSTLANHQVSSLSRVEVKTVNGVVHLTGVVKTQADKDEAARLSKTVEGVKRVDNDLTVQA